MNKRSIFSLVTIVSIGLVFFFQKKMQHNLIQKAKIHSAPKKQENSDQQKSYRLQDQFWRYSKNQPGDC